MIESNFFPVLDSELQQALDYDHKNPDPSVMLLNKFLGHDAARREIEALVDTKLNFLKGHIRVAMVQGDPEWKYIN